MTCKQPTELAGVLKGKKNVLVLTGPLCDEVDFNGKKLLDYATGIADKINAPVGATANTSLGVKAKGVKKNHKMWLGEVVSYMRFPWKHPIMDQKPELLVFIGYQPKVAQGMASAVGNAETMVLGNTEIKGATHSLPDSSSWGKWQQSLDEIVKAL